MPININEIVTKGASKLEKKFMGGVTAESAKKAIEDTANEVKKQMDEIARVGINEVKNANQKAMAALKENHLRELAAKDRENLSLKQAEQTVKKEKDTLAGKLDKLMARVKEGLTYKQIDTLEDGSKVFEKHNLNGAKAIKTVNKEGKTTQVNVELADKTFRRTSYNPETGKPTRTITNATKDGKTVEIQYNEYGQSKKPNVLNVKKSKTAKTPEITKRKVENISDTCVEVETFYADGSRIKAEVDRRTNEVTNWTKWDSDSSGWWSEWYSKDRDGNVFRGKLVKSADGKRYEKRVATTPGGIVKTMPYARHENEFTGMITNIDRLVFPKSSPVKRIEISRPEGTNSISKSVVKMKDGTIYEMTNYKEVPSNRELRPGGGREVDAPQKVVIIAKDGTKTEMKQEEIMPWLESFHPDYNFNLYK